MMLELAKIPTGFITLQEAAKILHVKPETLYGSKYASIESISPPGLSRLLKENSVREFAKSHPPRRGRHDGFDYAHALQWAKENVHLEGDVQKTRARGMRAGFSDNQLRRAEHQLGFGSAPAGNRENRTFTYRVFDDSLKEDTISVFEAAELLNMTPRYLSQLRAKGKVESILVGNEHRFDSKIIEQLMLQRISNEEDREKAKADRQAKIWENELEKLDAEEQHRLSVESYYEELLNKLFEKKRLLETKQDEELERVRAIWFGVNDGQGVAVSSRMKALDKVRSKYAKELEKVQLDIIRKAKIFGMSSANIAKILDLRQDEVLKILKQI